MFKLIKDQAGFSLVQGMIIASVLAGSALVATRLLTDQKQAQRGAETRDQIEQLHSLIHSTLQHQDHCRVTMTESFGALVPLTGSNTIPANRGIYVFREGAAPVLVFAPNPTLVTDVNRTYMNNNVMIRSMVLTYGATTANLTLATLGITYHRLDSTNRTGTGVGGKDVRKDVRLVIQRNPDVAGAPFLSCYAVTEANAATAEGGNVTLSREFCQSLNVNGTVGGIDPVTGQFQSLFEWDANNNLCRLKDHRCPSGQIFTGINSMGITKCRRLEEWIDVRDLFDLNPYPACPDPRWVRFTIIWSGGQQKARIGCFN